MIAEPPLDAPDEEWLVWADAMQQVGDPRGELIALGYRDAYVRKHGEALFGPVLGRHVRKGDIRVTRWRRCYADELELRIADAALGPQLVVDVLRSPAAATMRGLSIAGLASPRGDGVDLSATLGWLRESELPRTLTSLALVDDRARSVDHLISRNYGPGPNLVVFGPLAELWQAFAHLEELRMVVADPGQIQYQFIRLPALRAFTLHALCWVEGLGDMLANARWPQLSSLELRLTEGTIANNPNDARAYRSVYHYDRQRESFDGTPLPSNWHIELETLFESLAALPLERLALTSFWNASEVLSLLEDFPLPASLVELDLSDSAFDRADAERLANNPLMLQLRRLVLERVKLPSPRALVGVGPEVVHSCAPAAPTYRYIVGME